MLGEPRRSWDTLPPPPPPPPVAERVPGSRLGPRRLLLAGRELVDAEHLEQLHAERAEVLAGYKSWQLGRNLLVFVPKCPQTHPTS